MPKDHQVSQLDATGSAPHIIRLHGPWEYEPLAFTQWGPSGESVDLPGDVPPAGTITIPADWGTSLGVGFRGRVLYKRRFGRPTNLDPNERVDLVLYGISGIAIVALNGDRLGEIKIGERVRRFELTELLLPRNELRIEVNLPRGGDDAAAGGIVSEVHLEIYEVTR
ncbi:MAG: hypothetical protein O3C40_09080 [Planctomycetota bacterium]|nr:hypothetical protein [Planctomycetota bacterium]